MPKTQTSCPRCRQPVVAEIEQLFDMNSDPGAKQRLLSGRVNMVNCPACGYQGGIATPIVYHDPEKELLLTYFPPELALPVNEQERMIGPLITQVTNRLPLEKRKAYLLRPQTMLTMDTMMERIMEADGITREVLQAQQVRLALLQRLLSTPDAEARATIIQQEEKTIDAEFFGMLSQLMQVTLSQGEENTARALAAVQQDLTTHNPLGRELKAQAEETSKAMKDLQEASKKGLTRESLLDMMINAPSEPYLGTLVGMARSGMDYEFFQALTTRIDKATGEEQQKLVALREKLLEMTKQIDTAVAEQLKQASAVLEKILAADDVEAELEKNLADIDDTVVELIKSELNTARKKGDLERVNKVERAIIALQKYNAPPPEIQFIEELLEAPDEAARSKILKENSGKVTPELIQMLANLAAQTESQGEQPELAGKIKELYGAVLRFSMQNQLRK